MPQQYTCATCGSPFVGYPSEQRRFCSLACRPSPVPRIPVEARFWQKVRRGDGCWLWTAGTDGRGYGLIGSRHGASPLKAHRVAYTLTHGPIPEGMEVCHRCDNPPCVRPDHLFLGTHGDNMRDAAHKHRLASGERRHFAKLTDAAVRSIRTRHATTRQVDLAAEFGVTPRTIRRVVAGKTWQHLDL